MTTFTTTQKDTTQAEKIRRQYLSREQNKMEQLKKLDDKVKIPGRIVSGIIGTIGALVMGGGMAMIMVNGVMDTGLALSIPGMLLALTAFPIYSIITNSRKKKYATEIMRLSEEIVGE